ncbi:hypothetical protein K4A83_21640 [Spirulina subsalsa FACHB-351]|uniref:O-antigen polymerase n=1 Tax=Spirulina subsalsa FACHB-351 TaxID=234711 RepID=A0ABT3LCL4_9CYAN|nr:hypothetical protein [Spirulina subsalsa]MCW6038844.1 hypothetical protein [Spirulina subsalsa FACHB-351]
MNPRLTQLHKVQLAEEENRGYIQTSTLILLAFASAYFSRVLDSIGFPSFINFAHFATIPLACWIALTKSRSKDREQTAISWMLFAGLFIFLWIMFASALLNDAGIINVIVNFLLFGEPFVLALTMACVPMNPKRVSWFRMWVIRFGFCNLIWATAQYILFVQFKMHPKYWNPDYIQGIFYESGAGHVVGSSVALTFGLYYWVSEKNAPLWKRLLPLTWGFWQMLVSDSKQVMLFLFMGAALLILTKFTSIVEAIQWLIGGFLAAYGLLFCAQNIPACSAFNTWARPEIYGPDGEATLLKTASIRIISSHMTTPLHHLFGLGPGHTVGRLGGWMIREYEHLLGPLGVTSHPATFETWQAVINSWLGDQSSMFSPLWGWAGIWGDTGWLGLASYLFLGYIVWAHLCKDDFCRFTILSVASCGFIFSQMEEPGYTLFVTMIIMIRWHEHRIQKL